MRLLNSGRIFVATILLAPLFAVTVIMASSGGTPPRGQIWYGTGWTKRYGDFLIKTRQSTFDRSGDIAWVARFTGDAGVHRLKLVLSRDTSGSWKMVWHGFVPINDVKSNEYANRRPVRDFLSLGATIPGRYLLAYRRGGTVLASGTFTLVK